jgi:hypothetical protein
VKQVECGWVWWAMKRFAARKACQQRDAVRVPVEYEALTVDLPVMVGANQYEVCEFVRATVFAFLNVVDLAPAWCTVASAYAATSVSGEDGFAVAHRDGGLWGADVKGLPGEAVDFDRGDGCIAEDHVSGETGEIDHVGCVGRAVFDMNDEVHVGVFVANVLPVGAGERFGCDIGECVVSEL